jgi:hypothetical protein
MITQTNSSKEQELSLRRRKLLSGEIKPNSAPVKFLTITEQRKLGIPTDSVSTSLRVPKK